ncbi:phenol hydroxylase subunit P4 [Streptomyces sp. RB6PN25]|uniref:Phenol hydroxylase subunit P4 n=1 Tax=Streptomyces humicola TaxID=2953240 RepID=A0ABT1PN76_9ACTN|nr:phenol hydroxylase subunit P4 [Streptomyces humicola]MCQ4079128.1 phenol hydroxylase subunit P4 [Streptomyces humicola]
MARERAGSGLDNQGELIAVAVQSIGTYEFPSRSRQELYGDDQLVHVLWRNNEMFCAAACFRAPRAMTWAEFTAGMVEPWAASDPSFVPGSTQAWILDDDPFSPQPGMSLASLGVGHKSLLTFEA